MASGSGIQYYFLSCTTDFKEITQIEGNKRIISIYHVCGFHPWLIVCKGRNLKVPSNLTRKYRLDIKYMSIGHRIKQNRRLISPQKDPTCFWIFIKGPEASTFIDEIDSFINADKFNFEISEMYEIFGEYHYILKCYAIGINAVDGFLEKCRNNGIVTSTKCVLTTLKENYRNIPREMRNKQALATKIKKELDYAIVRIMFNNPGFLQKYDDKYKQINLLKNELAKLDIFEDETNIENYVLDPETGRSEYSKDNIVHPNRFIERYSITLKRDKWLKTLLFFKANSKPELEKALQENFLGVSTTRFAKKLYHITGDYDFLIPYDCENIPVLTDAINIFFEKYGNLISAFTNTICYPYERIGIDRSNPLDTFLIESLLINSTHITDFESTVKDKKIFAPILQNEELLLAEEGITPRDDHARNAMKDERYTAVAAYLKTFTSFDNIGVESSLEFKDGTLIHTLFKFYFNDLDAKKEFLYKIKKKSAKNEIITTLYEPVRDPLIVMSIFAVKDIVELEVLFDELIAHCKKIEFHVIFHQTHYSRVIEQDIRCKPCFYPIKPKEECVKEYDACVKQWCKDRRNCIIQNCGNCIRYVLPRNRNRILNINHQERLKRHVRIAVVGINLSLPEFFILEKTMDREGFRNEIFGKYKDFYQKHAAENDMVYMPPDEVVDRYGSIRNRDAFRRNYTNGIIELFDLLAEDIIVFPEYSIPSYVFNALRKMEIKRDCVVVAGSQINERFNVCPVLFNYATGEKMIYLLYKNDLNTFEKEIGLVKNKGTAHLKFMNTSFGNLFILLCFDSYRLNPPDFYKKVDIMVVPSYNPSLTFVDSLRSLAMDYKMVVAYANTMNTEKLESDILGPPDQMKASKQGIEPFHTDQYFGTKFSKKKRAIIRSEPVRTEIRDFKFLIKMSTVDIFTLDMQRGKYTVR